MYFSNKHLKLITELLRNQNLRVNSYLADHGIVLSRELWSGNYITNILPKQSFSQADDAVNAALRKILSNSLIESCIEGYESAFKETCQGISLIHPGDAIIVKEVTEFFSQIFDIVLNSKDSMDRDSFHIIGVAFLLCRIDRTDDTFNDWDKDLGPKLQEIAVKYPKIEKR